MSGFRYASCCRVWRYCRPWMGRHAGRQLTLCCLISLMFVLFMYNDGRPLPLSGVSLLLVLMSTMISDDVFKVIRSRSRGMRLLLLPASNQDKYAALVMWALLLSFVIPSASMAFVDTGLLVSGCWLRFPTGHAGSLHAQVFAAEWSVLLFYIAVGLSGVTFSLISAFSGRSWWMDAVEIAFVSLVVVVAQSFRWLLPWMALLLLVADAFNGWLGYRFFTGFQLEGRRS